MPVYHADLAIMEAAFKMAQKPMPADFKLQPLFKNMKIAPGLVAADSGAYSFASFQSVLQAVLADRDSAMVNLPINKAAWALSGNNFAGHTEYFRKAHNYSPIMMLGGPLHFVMLYTDHIPLSQVPAKVNLKELSAFMLKLSGAISLERISVLGLNPHCGEGGMLGNEDQFIVEAIKQVNHQLGKELYAGPISADSHFAMLSSKPTYTLAIYHDQGLVGIKTLAFKEAIQVSLNLPFCRTAVDHGTAMDIAYTSKQPSNTSFINALKYAAGAN